MNTTDTPSSTGAGALWAALPPIDHDANRRLHARLVAAAAADGLLDVAYRTIDTPVGRLLVAATDQGLVRIAYTSQGHDEVLADLADKVSPRILHAPARLGAVARQIDEYFAGTRTAFDLPLDLRVGGPFRREVLVHLADVAYGETVSYATLANVAGRPKAVRAVGTTCALNPLPIVIPCHRVVRSDGSVGGYAGGPDAKLTLLALEAAA